MITQHISSEQYKDTNLFFFKSHKSKAQQPYIKILSHVSILVSNHKKKLADRGGKDGGKKKKGSSYVIVREEIRIEIVLLCSP